MRHSVFWPPFLLLLSALVFSISLPEVFLQQVTGVNDWILNQFGFLFSYGTLGMVFICTFVAFSPLGKIRIGGEDAKPLLSRWKWFSITLCTTVAIGILFWGSSEPLYHLHAPPLSLNIEANSAAAAQFSISTMFLHWTFTPYAIYTIPSLMFALAYYNMGKPFTLGSVIVPFASQKNIRSVGTVVDVICLYALVAGMSASLGAGIKTLVGGGNYLFGISENAFTLGIVTLAIVGTFIVSATSGLMKGIRILSDCNAKIFFALSIFVFIFGPTMFILEFSYQGIGDYFSSFFDRSLMTATEQDRWPLNWTVFYWANWLAWAPISALFLGRISYGYRVRDFILFNWILPAIFSIFWMSIFSSTAIHFDFVQNIDLYSLVKNGGPEKSIYKIFSELPLATFVILVFIFTSFLSYVTSADSNTTAMAGISCHEISPENPEAPMGIKIAWGLLIGGVAWTMINSAGIDGIKMLSNLGGLPALFLVIIVSITLFVVAVKPDKYLLKK